VGEIPGYDPSDTGISGVFVGAFHEYMQTQLKYNPDTRAQSDAKRQRYYCRKCDMGALSNRAHAECDILDQGVQPVP
jgi:hypothetical protein